jgi:hypothetical protein
MALLQHPASPDTALRAIQGYGLASALVEVMRAQVSDVDLQRKALLLLLRMVHVDDVDAEVLRVAGALKAATTALRLHGADDALQEDACCFLRFVMPVNCADDNEAATLQALLAVLRAPGSSRPEALAHACVAIAKLACSAGAAARAGELGAVAALVAVLRAHADDAEVQHAGCMALDSVVRGAPEKVAHAVRANALDAVTGALLHGEKLRNGDVILALGVMLSNAYAVAEADEARAAATTALAAEAAQRVREQTIHEVRCLRVRCVPCLVPGVRAV